MRRRRVKADFLLILESALIIPVQVAAAGAAKKTFNPHIPNWPELDPFDFFLFPKHKSHLRSRHFINNDEAMCAM